jgi:hypothetical protein
MKKICKMCKEEKEFIDFTKNCQTKDGYRAECRECSKIYYQKVRKENIKEYNLQNKEKRSIYYKKYYEQNNIKIILSKKIYKRTYTKKRRLEDPLFKLSCSIRTLIYSSIKRQGYKKNSKTSNILGCSFEEFKAYIESQFNDKMSWDNYGEWHLDHKTPISWAETEEQVYELSKYTNFQPLWQFENLSKGNKYSD